MEIILFFRFRIAPTKDINKKHPILTHTTDAPAGVDKK